jgi:hypothetical protein
MPVGVSVARSGHPPTEEFRMTPTRRSLITAAACLALAGAAAAAPAGRSIAERTRAARLAAETDPHCTAVRPFYWSIGDAGGMQAEGRVGRRAPEATTPMPIASASKWVYGAYVLQKHGGVLSASDIAFLTFVSGYTDFSKCRPGQTVGGCDAWRRNGAHEDAHDGRFFYNGGHMQKHASIDGEAADDDALLAQRVDAALGTTFAYAEPQLAGGIRTSAAEYGRFLQRIVAGELRMHDALGAHAVCTNPATCPSADYTPMPASESPHYAIGHWVEDDPVAGDGAFSSAGAFGFYPWIDRQVRWWGVLARFDLGVASQPGPGVESLYCGREIRAAWIGDAQR